MELTTSYERTFPAEVIARYQWLETRNGAAVMKASNESELGELTKVLEGFYVYDADILVAGGNRGQIPRRLDGAFGDLGWSAVRVNTTSSLVGQRKAAPGSRTYDDTFLNTTVASDGFEVDNFKARVALDVEWNAKDGNLDRDLSAYRALYEMGLIDVAVIITRDHQGIRDLAGKDLRSDDAFRRLGTTTTTNMVKLESRLTRGDAGGCPVLAVGITRATWAGPGIVVPQVADPDDGESTPTPL